MAIATDWTRRVGVTHPIIQAPMSGGGITTAELVAAVSEAGGYGFVPSAYLKPAEFAERCREVRARTSRPFGVNLFAPLPRFAAPPDLTGAIARVAPFYAELGLPPPSAPAEEPETFDELLGIALGSGASALSFTFGVIPHDAVAALKARRMLVLGTATSVEEARRLEASGVDAVITQGSEAGGHRGTFAASFDGGLVGTMALVPQVADAVSVPVIASGGIMDGRGIAAALALGASAAQMGTAFLTANEAGTPDAYKDAVTSAHEDQTRLTRAFSGRPARGVVNRFIREVEGETWMNAQQEILPFPWQNTLTRPLRAAAAKQGRAEYLSLWAGQGVRLARREPVSELMSRWVRELDEVASRLASKVD